MIDIRMDGIKKNASFNLPEIKKSGVFLEPKKVDGLQIAQKNNTSIEREIVQKEILADEQKNNTKENLARINSEQNKVINEKKAEQERQAKQARIIARNNKIKQFKRNIKIKIYIFFVLLKKRLISTLKILLLFLTALILLMVVLYLIYASLILKFSADNSLTRLLNNIFPVPAIVAGKEIITYNQYRAIYKIEEKKGLENISARVERAALGETITNNLLEKHPVKPSLTAAELNRLVMNDREINQVAWARMNTIRKEMAAGGFEAVYQKFGDGYSAGEYLTRQEAVKKFNDSLINYGGDKLSPILIGDQGLYIIKVADNKTETLGVKYVFIKAIGLEEYITGEISRLKIIRLIR